MLFARPPASLQTTVSGSETGRVAVSESDVAKVLKACGLPKDWSAPAPEATASDIPTELREKDDRRTGLPYGLRNHA